MTWMIILILCAFRSPLESFKTASMFYVCSPQRGAFRIFHDVDDDDDDEDHDMFLIA